MIKSKVTTRPPAVKYLSNKELLAEIARCKNSFCTYLSPEFAEYDYIIHSMKTITPSYIGSLLEDAPDKNSIILRVMTFDHIPIDPDRKRKNKATNENHFQLNFPPFKHYLVTLRDNEVDLKEVGRSHWDGDFDTGNFSLIKGRISERMGLMFYKLVQRYLFKGSWRGYSFKQDMEGLALMHLSQVGLQFDESKSANAFAFYTTTLRHCFIRTINIEKKNQDIRDDLLIEYGMTPSYTRQIQDEMTRLGIESPKPLPAKRGRRTAVMEEAIRKAEESNPNPDPDD